MDVGEKCSHFRFKPELPDEWLVRKLKEKNSVEKQCAKQLICPGFAYCQCPCRILNNKVIVEYMFKLNAMQINSSRIDVIFVSMINRKISNR